MRERPILFSAPMVRGILEDRKTMTRRALNERDLASFTAAADLGECGRFLDGQPITLGDRKYHSMLCRYGEPGDRLWVRESFWEAGCWEPDYGEPGSGDIAGSRWKKFGARCFDEDLLIPLPGQKWRRIPSIHMPRVASRILLEITSTRIERLHEITEEDAVAEGVELAHPGTPSTWYKDYMADKIPDALESPYHGLLCTAFDSFASLWSSINGDESWESNPWVWVVEFRRVEATP